MKTSSSSCLPGAAPALEPCADDLFYPPPEGHRLVGLPRLMETAFRGLPLAPLGQTLMARAEGDPLDANALMDLSCIARLQGQAALGAQLQAQALVVSRHYTLPAVGVERLRVLALMRPGALMDNLPIEFLLHGSDVALDMLYLDPDAAPDVPVLPATLPPHDVLCVAVCEADHSRALLQRLAVALAAHPVPVLEDPTRIVRLARAQAWRWMQGTPGVVMPPSLEVSRATLAQLATGARSVADSLPGAGFPIICRPLGSHGGHALERLANAADVAGYLDRVAPAGHEAAPDTFVISPFVDYRSADGQYRKMRIALVGGHPYPVHLAVSTRWMVHYINGDMAGCPDNRADEQRWLDGFYRDFGRRHAQALAALDARVGLDYYSIDAAETPDGQLLIFEIDTGGVVHAMDPLEGYGYKRAPMLRLFAAFQSLLLQTAARPACPRPPLPDAGA